MTTEGKQITTIHSNTSKPTRSEVKADSITIAMPLPSLLPVTLRVAVMPIPVLPVRVVSLRVVGLPFVRRR